MTRPTVGKLATDLLKSAHQNDHTAHDQMREMLTDYEKNMHEAIVEGCKRYDGDFFIVVLVKKERLFQNVMRNYYLPRKTCPTPQHDQVVYHYHRTVNDIEFLWVVPSPEACVTLYNEMALIHPEERQLLQFVLDFKDGTLLRTAMKLNGEFTDNARKDSNGRSKRDTTGKPLIVT